MFCETKNCFEEQRKIENVELFKALDMQAYRLFEQLLIQKKSDITANATTPC
jgi:hypothetical protein